MAKNRTDYTQARARYIKGHCIKDIASDLNLPYEGLVKFAQRNQWDKLRTEIVQNVSDAVRTDVQGRLGQWVGKIDKIIHSGLDNVLAKGVDNMDLKQLGAAIEIAERVNRIGRAHYGLDDRADNRSNVHIAITTAGFAPPAAVALLPADKSDVIDV